LSLNVEVVSRSKVDELLPRHQHVNLRIVRDLSLNVEVLLRALAFVGDLTINLTIKGIVKHPQCCHACLAGPSPSNAEANVVAGGRWVGPGP